MAQLLESNLPIEKTKHAPLHAGQQGGMEALLTQWKHVAPCAAGAAIWKDGEDFATPLLSGVVARVDCANARRSLACGYPMALPAPLK